VRCANRLTIGRILRIGLALRKWRFFVLSAAVAELWIRHFYIVEKQERAGRAAKGRNGLIYRSRRYGTWKVSIGGEVTRAR
jgi:hypothetical protein